MDSNSGGMTYWLKGFDENGKPENIEMTEEEYYFVLTKLLLDRKKEQGLDSVQ